MQSSHRGRRPPAEQANASGRTSSVAATIPWRAPATIALLTTVAVLSTLSPDSGGPGTTCDEYLYAAAGKRLVTALGEQGFAFFRPASIEANYGGIELHPPLGRWLMGLAQLPLDPWPGRPEAVWLPAARIAPALVFGGLIFLVGFWVGSASGPIAGAATAAAVALMPRMFGHAHLAALDLFTAAFCTAVIVAVEVAARSEPHFDWRRVLSWSGAGILLGLAMLSRINGFLLVPPVLFWMVWRMKWHALWSGAIWLLVGLGTFVIGWPWLWAAPVARFTDFLTSATARQSINVFYLGRVWQDRDVPWHYPWVILGVTIPVGFLLLAAAGVWLRPRRLLHDHLLSLVVINLLFLLLVFTAPGTPVYDGERLFLFAVPLVAVLAGMGLAAIFETAWCRRIERRWRIGLAAAFIGLQGIGILAYHPFELSHYNLLVGGLPGATALGFESTYWGDTIDAPLLVATSDAASGEPVLFGPNLAPFQAPAVGAASTTLRASGVSIVGWDASSPGAAAGCRYLIVYRRRADVAGIEHLMRSGRVIAERSRQGIWLSRLYALDPPLQFVPNRVR